MSKPTTSLTKKARDIVNTYAISVFIHAGLGANTDLARTQNVRDVVSPGSSRKVFMMSWTLTGILPVGGAYTWLPLQGILVLSHLAWSSLPVDSAARAMQFAVFAWGKFRTAELKTLGGQTRMQRYWLWVTRPQYYLEPDGTDRRDIDPLSSVSLQESWTCHKDTKEGDWALLYRTSPKCDIAYLMRVGSDAYSLAGNPDALQNGWSYGCAIRVIHKFRKPLPLATLRDDPVLQKWGALRRNFQGIAFPIESQYWQRLSQLLCGPNPEFVKVLKNLERDS